MRDAELIFIDVPPLFQQAHRAFFKNWADNYVKDGPIRSLALMGDDLLRVYQSIDPVPLTHGVQRVTFNSIYAIVTHRIRISPLNPVDIDILVTWERKKFVREYERGRMVAPLVQEMREQMERRSAFSPYIWGA